jgi:SAM-dependent methyltransferase
LGEYQAFYARALYYDVAFRRDVGPEVDFLCALFEQRRGRKLASMADIACGPAYHGRIMAARGIEAVGIDLRQEMCDFARDEAAAEGIALKTIAADMRDFRLDRPVDLALTSYDSLDCLLDFEQVADHFRCVAANLRPDGLYVVEMTHPRDCNIFDYGDYVYAGTRDGIDVRISWATNGPVIDYAAEVAHVEMLVEVNDKGRMLRFVDAACERLSGPQELAAIAALSGRLKLLSLYGDFRLDQPYDASPGSRRLIAVLAPTGASR